MDNQLIIVRQLPIIEEHLQAMKQDIDTRVKDALSLACTAETRQDVKKVRTELRKELEALETQRKAVKAKIEEPYKQFETIYRDVVGGLKQADVALGNKIGAVEAELIEAKTAKIQAYHEELCGFYSIDFIPLARVGLKINLSTTEKSLKDSLSKYLQGIVGDMKTIQGMDDAAEIMAEYKKSLLLNDAIRTVSDRHKAIQLEQMRQDEAAKVEAEEAKRVEAVEAFAAPVVAPVEAPAVPRPYPVDARILKAHFTCYGTKAQLVALKKFMKDGGIRFE